MRDPVLAKVRTEAPGRSGPEAEGRVGRITPADESCPRSQVTDWAADGREEVADSGDGTVLPPRQDLPRLVVDRRSEDQGSQHDSDEEVGD